ncbi:MAG: YidC/Oxa1 family membrane protein insertase [Anaerolineae bacterium]|nr:YidC/Oxa1 family membrane protein insertase [Anaerolineae bacterium]
MGEIFNLVLLRPVLNVMLFLYSVLGHNYALAIVVLTVLLRLITQPFMSSQLKTSKKMAELQPQLKEIEKKHSGDKERIAQEQMKLYRQHGINPMGGCLPMLLQFPIWIALYQGIIQTLGQTPLNLLSLSKHIYTGGVFQRLALPLLIPLSSTFLGIDLGLPGGIVIAALVGLTMWIQQKMTTPAPEAGSDSPQAAFGQSMSLFMPVVFAIFTVNLPAGLGIYFIVSSLIGIVMQGFTTGWGGLTSLLPRSLGLAAPAPPAVAQEKRSKSGRSKKKR